MNTVVGEGLLTICSIGEIKTQSTMTLYKSVIKNQPWNLQTY